MDINKFFFKYFVYCPVVMVRGEWHYPHLKRMLRTQYFSESELRLMQLHKLNKLMAHAKEHVPYYQSLPSKLSSIDEISSLPLLEKEALRDSFSSLLSSKASFLCRDKTSGGSTGAPITVRKDNHSMAQELAAAWRGYQWAGVDIGDRQARFWGVPADKKQMARARIIDAVTNRCRLSAFRFSDSELLLYVDKLRKFKPVYFYGYVSMLRQFAAFVKSECAPETLNPKAIIATSEVLSDVDRLFLQSVFGCKVYNEYGCGEVGTIAHECEHGSLHVSSENVVVEIVDKNGIPVPFGQVGEIVVTELNNFAMPLIRYRMRDFGFFTGKPCSCGRGLPVIGGVHGREYDFLINSEGKRFHGEFFLYIIEDVKKSGVSLKAVQFEQQSEKKLLVRMVSGLREFEAAKKEVLSRINKDFDPDVSVFFERVSEIPREASGKLRVVKRSF